MLYSAFQLTLLIETANRQIPQLLWAGTSDQSVRVVTTADNSSTPFSCSVGRGHFSISCWWFCADHRTWSSLGDSLKWSVGDMTKSIQTLTGRLAGVGLGKLPGLGLTRLSQAMVAGIRWYA